MRLQNYQIRKQIKARFLRKYRGGLIKNKTTAESLLEDMLKRLGLDYIFQAGFLSPKSFYIVDFYIKSPYKLVIEVDGENHKQRKRIIFDKRKMDYLRKCGFKVLRFSNEAILNQRQKVKRQLSDSLPQILRYRLKNPDQL